MGEGESSRERHLKKAYKVSVAAFIFTSLAAVEAMLVRDPILVQLVIAPSFEEFTKFAGISLWRRIDCRGAHGRPTCS